MKQKFILCLFAMILLFVLIVGCSNRKSEESITMEGEVVLHSIDKNENYLTISTTIQNNQNKDTEPFYVKLIINDKWLGSQFDDTEIIVGKEIRGDDGKLFTIKKNAAYQIGENYKIASPIDEKKLKRAIEKDKVVEVILLNEDKKVIGKGYVEKFWKQIES